MLLMSKYVCIMFVFTGAAGGNDEPDAKSKPGKIYMH